jgi:hypothetical protein
MSIRKLLPKADPMKMKAITITNFILLLLQSDLKNSFGFFLFLKKSAFVPVDKIIALSNPLSCPLLNLFFIF